MQDQAGDCGDYLRASSALASAARACSSAVRAASRARSAAAFSTRAAVISFCAANRPSSAFLTRVVASAWRESAATSPFRATSAALRAPSMPDTASPSSRIGACEWAVPIPTKTKTRATVDRIAASEISDFNFCNQAGTYPPSGACNNGPELRTPPECTKSGRSLSFCAFMVHCLPASRRKWLWHNARRICVRTFRVGCMMYSLARAVSGVCGRVA